jgi:hypothetical protein
MKPSIKRHAGKSAMAATLLATAMTAGAGTTVSFNADGQGGDAIEIGALDWLQGSVLISSAPGGEQAIPTTPGAQKVVQNFAHGVLIRAGNPDGDPVGIPNLNNTYEISFVTSSGINLGTSADGTLVHFDEAATGSNFFQIMYDDFSAGTRASALAGTGFGDGQVILSGQIVEVSGNFGTEAVDPVDLDSFIAPNSWPGTTTVSGSGAQTLAVLVQSVDTSFFEAGVAPGTILPFNNSQVLPFLQSKPSRNFDEDTSGTATRVASVGNLNGFSGPDMLLQIDPNNSFEYLPPQMACRVTGGGNDTSGIDEDNPGWDGSTAAASVPDTVIQVPKGRGGKFKTVVIPGYDWTMGGQAGANTAKQPQPKGEWEHNNHAGPEGLQFAFHGGTSSASPGTEIDEIICTDPDYCRQARPAPSKQIDFVGIGEFSNFQLDDSSFAGDGVHTFPGIADVVTGSSGCKPNGNGPNSCARNPDQVGTLHWFQVHIEDAGEPGNKFEDGASCPIEVAGVKGHGNDPFLNPPRTDNNLDCGCADFYRITIYKGFEPTFNGDGEVTNPNKTDKIYEVWGYLDGGNFQIHPLTGFDLK